MKFANILAVSALTLAALPASSEELSFANFTPPFHTAVSYTHLTLPTICSV